MTELRKQTALDDKIAICVILLMATGAVFVFSASANISHDIDLRHFYNSASLRQILFFPLAILIMFAASAINYHRFEFKKSLLKSPAVYALAFSIALLAIVLYQRFHPVFPTFIPKIHNHYRWLKIPLGPITISFQPSELAKWAIVFFLAGICAKKGFNLQLFRKRFVPLCAIIAIAVGLIIIEDLGTAAFIALLAFIILIVAGAKWRHMLAPLPFALIAFCLILWLYPHRMQRIVAFLKPTELADSANYQANQSLIALGSGGLFGKGLGSGICKYGHLPEDTTDFIFAIIGEELGFAGTATVITLFIAFLWLGILVIKRTKDDFGKILAAGVVLTIAIQAAINIGVVTVVLPTKGIPLPFVSAGGTSMLLSAAAVGILLNIAKQTGKEQPNETLQTNETAVTLQALEYM
jgi:cell division protein FtsW